MYTSSPLLGKNLGGGGGGMPLGVENLTFAPNHSAHKTYTLSQYLRKLPYASPELVWTDSLFCYVSPYINKILVRSRPAHAVAGTEKTGLS